jgi:hypothetical protein
VQICYTDDLSGLIATIESNLVLACKKDAKNMLLTQMLTGVQGPQGFTVFMVRETPMEIAKRVNAAKMAEGHPEAKWPTSGDLGFQEN